MMRFMCLLAICCFSIGAALAQPVTDPVPLPTDHRVVVFTYDANGIYTLLTLPGAHTHIELGEGEGITMQPRLGDTVQWRVDGGPRHIFIKPIRPNLVTTMTLVTNRHTYQFELRASAAGGKRYQKVSFQYPDDEEKVRFEAEAATARVKAEAQRLDAQNLSPATDPVQHNFAYEIEGTAQWKPVTVFDDGKFTYFRIGTKAQDLPALFLVDKDGKATLVNSTVRGEFVVVQRTAERFLLKLGGEEVKVTQRGARRGGGVFSWFSSVNNGGNP